MAHASRPFPSNGPSPRSARLTRYLDQILSGRYAIKTPANGNLFLEAICDKDDRKICIEKVLASATGLSSLKESFRLDLSDSFLNGHAMKFIRYLQEPGLKRLCNGQFLQQIILQIVEPPTFWNALIQAHKKRVLEESTIQCFAWLLLELLSLPRDQSIAYQEIANAVTEDKSLLDSSSHEIRILGQRIHNSLLVLACPSAKNGQDAPGGRHDNDHVDYREISILPTADELASKEKPFIRRATEIADSDDNDRAALHLDNQFRLLREDMLEELRTDLHIARGLKKGFRRSLVIKGLSLHGVDCGIPDWRKPCGLTFQCKTDLAQLAHLEPKKRRSYLTENKRFLKDQSVACLLTDQKDIIAFAIISRNEDLLARRPPVIVLQFSTEPAFLKALIASHTYTDIQLLQVDTPLFAYEPVLKCLQEKKELQLSEELLFFDSNQRLQNNSNHLLTIIEGIRANPTQDLKRLLGAKCRINLDASQVESLLAGLTQRVALIQGPPGTGKSFIGALLTKVLHNASSDKILVVCYTNHALDQFLEDLLDIGIPATDIVRLGSKSTPKTLQLTLRAQNSRSRTGRDAWQIIDRLKVETGAMEQQLSNAINQYQNLRVTPDEILQYLEFPPEDPVFYKALTVAQPEDEMTMVGKRGKAIGSDYLLDRWNAGKDAGALKRFLPDTAVRVWRMSVSLRRSRMAAWKHAILEERTSRIYSLAMDYNKLQKRLSDMLNERSAQTIRGRRIIGCTTTAAAKYSSELQAASPDVVLVEEAGEILESHVLTAMGRDTKQLILIGDHKQLRPKVNSYELTVEKGSGFDLNRSLFERLVHGKLSHNTLSEQHRMCPEISALVRCLTYPELRDAKSTMNRLPLLGFQDKLVFFNHEQPEDELFDLVEVRDKTSKTSKTNKFEVEMVLKCVRYLGQQGYGTDKLVILTPYLGQLRLLKETLSKDHDPVLNDLDSYDLVRAGLLPSASAKLNRQPIRISTIDNYQGEESDIVIASLTRSNSTADIGFMAAPERLNVLISRARNALIMIGNAQTFLNARKGKDTWVPFFDVLRKDGHVYDGFPIKCERHPGKAWILRCPEDFDLQCPDGGCSEPCGTKLPCDIHNCPQRCHRLKDHSKMTCYQFIKEKCEKGHKYTWQCVRKRPTKCPKCEVEEMILLKKLQRDAELEAKRQAAQEAYAREIAKMDEKIEKQRQISKDYSDAENRKKMLKQKEKDLAAAQSLTSRIVSSMFSPKSSTPSTTQESPHMMGSQGGSTSTIPSSTLHQPQLHVQSKSAAKDEWDDQKKFEGVANDALDSLMEMIGLEDVKLKFLNIKAKVDTALRQQSDLKSERFGAALLGNPGTGIFVINLQQVKPNQASDAQFCLETFQAFIPQIWFFVESQHLAWARVMLGRLRGNTKRLKSGLGKTTVARLYAKFLTSFGVIPGDEFIETTGSRLANERVDGAKKCIENLIKAGGGALFIDEAYQLVASHNHGGAQVLDFLLAEIENQTGKIVVILAGYNKQMEAFFEHNPGIPSRIPHSLKFADYDDTELLQILCRLISKKYRGRMKVEDSFDGLYLRIAARRIGRGRGREGFGNARAVENAFSRIQDRQADRLRQERKQGKKPDDFFFTKEDIIGPEPSKAVETNSSWVELQGLIGLKDVKESVRCFLDRIQQNYRRELEEKPIIDCSLNKVFLGNPGTGKTTVAKLYGQILADLGLLSNGEGKCDILTGHLALLCPPRLTKHPVIVKNPADFVGSVLGQSESNTKAILASTIGKVLIIDEAYMLSGGFGGDKNQGDPYKTAVIDTIVAEVQSVAGDDQCVLLLGYRDQMENMFQSVNPGLSRRFPLDSAFDFEDFEDGELAQILDLKLKKQGFSTTEKGKDVALEVLRRARVRPNFGNAGEVDILLDRAKAVHQKRLSKQLTRDLDTLEPGDFDEDFDRGTRAATNCRQLFKGVVGCEGVIAKLEGYQRIAQNMKKRNLDPKEQIPFNFLFKGPPGTGKTTTARKMGKVFYDMGFLSSAKVEDCSATDLIGQYVGQTGPKVLKQLDKALGRVLFIDEAYRLGDGGFATEAMNELVDSLTKPKYAKKLITILAGYDADMNRLMSINPGLTSRFPESIIFESLASSDALKLLSLTLKKSKVDTTILQDTSSPLYTSLLGLLDELSGLPSWGNARDVQTLSKEIYASLISAEVDSTTALTLDSETLLESTKAMLAERKSRITNLPPSLPLTGNLPTLSLTPNPPQTPAYQTSTTITKNINNKPPTPLLEQVKTAAKHESSSKEAERDAEVSDEIWEALQRDKAAAERRLQEEYEETLLKAEQLRQAKEAEARKKALEELERIRREAEEKRRKEALAQEKLRNMGVCVQGFQWIKQGSGYRCAGGAHYISNDRLGI
ncbi:MAG: hypothetical protein M1834_006140 [Cirrosporium novae-zelandiae]|nr:MAG: hypothetical protein M1834_006140 [Cirrosporium novae-zelandiae]